MVDSGKVGQVIMNLLSNALKFTPNGGHVQITAENDEVTVAGLGQNQKVVCIMVKDTGMGIPPEELPTIFERYKQASTAKRIRQKGTGLGLAICKLIVEAHKGSIWVESQLRKGSLFSFSLPLTRPQAQWVICNNY